MLGRPLVGAAVVGATTIEQLAELCDAACAPALPPAVLERVDAIHERLPNPAP